MLKNKHALRRVSMFISKQQVFINKPYY